MSKVREGYKETEVGVVPDEWNVVKLSKIVSNRSEKYTPSQDESIPYIALEHIDQGTGRLLAIGDSSETTSTKSVFYKNDILFGKLRPYLRKYWLSDIDGVCSTEILSLKPLENHAFAFYLIQSDKFIESVSKKAFGTKMPRTSWNDIKDYKFALPPIEEQQRIAQILTTTDNHIEKLDKTIEDYQLLKKAMMKKLLTEGIGHSEFKETAIGRIPQEWEVAELDEIGQFRKGKGIKKDEVLSSGLPCIRYGEIYTTYNHVVKNTKSYINEVTAQNSMLISKNEIIFAGSGETVEDIGKAVVYLNDKPCYVGGDTIIMKPASNINALFLSYYLATNNVTKQKRKLGQGNSVVHIYVDGIKSIKIAVPRGTEQQQIASMLSELDTRIELYQKEREDFIQLKKSLLQKLLNGRIRVGI